MVALKEWEEGRCSKNCSKYVEVVEGSTQGAVGIQVRGEGRRLGFQRDWI